MNQAPASIAGPTSRASRDQAAGGVNQTMRLPGHLLYLFHDRINDDIEVAIFIDTVKIALVWRESLYLAYQVLRLWRAQKYSNIL
ncbi:MAG: hypothetical protein A2521_07625 [Deltaproteobacteria bacterium RIFOXYD12_FULL_57_12]|nr:MAG: hypothetical protein A2521_07625 [Deltaproteobacteria bacterium RIFOXYD12_FULL_57_12]